MNLYYCTTAANALLIGMGRGSTPGIHSDVFGVSAQQSLLGRTAHSASRASQIYEYAPLPNSFSGDFFFTFWDWHFFFGISFSFFPKASIP